MTVLPYSLRQKIADEAILWANECELEASKDERPPKPQSNFQHRVNQDRCLQRIKQLVKELHEFERDLSSLDPPKNTVYIQLSERELNGN